MLRFPLFDSHRLCPGLLDGIKDCVHDEVALCGRRRAHSHGLVGSASVELGRTRHTSVSGGHTLTRMHAHTQHAHTQLCTHVRTYSAYAHAVTLTCGIQNLVKICTHSLCVCIAVHSHGFDAHFSTCSHNLCGGREGGWGGERERKGGGHPFMYHVHVHV